MLKGLSAKLLIPALLAAMLTLWYCFAKENFIAFYTFPLFFVLGWIINAALRKRTGRSFRPFLIFYLVLSLLFCFGVTPNPFRIASRWSSLSKNERIISISDLGKNTRYDVVHFNDARTLPEFIETNWIFNNVHMHGGKGIVPVVSNSYKAGDSIEVYAAFTTYVGDPGNDSWFILDKDEDDYSDDWKEPASSARIEKDTSQIRVYTEMMNELNSRKGLVSSQNVQFIQWGYPHKDTAYSAKILWRIGIILIVLIFIIEIKIALSPAPNAPQDKP
jgi:hypothetical protein